MEGSASVNLSPSTTRSTPEAPGSSHFSDAHSRFDVAQDISFSRFQQSLLGVVHDKDTVERRARDLEARLQGQVAATKGAQADASELQSRLDDASRTKLRRDRVLPSWRQSRTARAEPKSSTVMM